MLDICDFLTGRARAIFKAVH